MADISHIGTYFSLRDPYGDWQDINISSIRYTELRKLQKELDAQRDAIRNLAAREPGWSQNKVASIMSKDSPGDEILHEFGILNRTLKDVLDALQAIEFWPGLQIFGVPFAPMLLTELPKQTVVNHGCPLEITTKAAGIPAPIYKWFYYPPNGAAAREIPGQNKPKLAIQQPGFLNEAWIICSICNIHGQRYTTRCHVIVETAVMELPPQFIPQQHLLAPVQTPSYTPQQEAIAPEFGRFTASDKVALLIGNGIYMNEKPLKAPPNDILKIGERLKRMNFKTLICKDLTKTSMENVLDFFITLLIDGVYGVLYFAGHGFETHRGNSFLVPSDSATDASEKCCISTIEVLNKILEKNPALCLVVLDICRVRKKSLSKDMPATARNKSSVIVYATNENQKAYERADMKEPLSVFATHLLKYIDDPIPLTDLMTKKVVRSVGDDKVAKDNQQNAELVLTLYEPRSLHDRIDYSGNTRKFDKNRLEWALVNEKPELKEMSIPKYGVDVKMVFTYKYSNSLIIHIGCLKTQGAKVFTANAHVSMVYPVSVRGCAKLELDREKWPKCGFYDNTRCLSVTENVLDKIEELNQDLIVSVLVDGSTQDGEKFSETFDSINLKRPLLAKLNYERRLQGRQVPLRVPVQHEEQNEAVENDDESFYTPVNMDSTTRPTYHNSMSSSTIDSVLPQALERL